jgi:hypothetical protein
MEHPFLYLFVFLGLLGLVCAVWLLVRRNAKDEPQIDEESLASACEGALIRELSDISFRSGK